MPYLDGTFPSGCPTVSINSVTYKLDSFSVNKSSQTVDITDNVGAPSGAISFLKARTGSMVVQFAASTTAEPTTAAQNSTTGTSIVSIDNANVNVFFESVTVNKPKEAPWTASINWKEKIN